MRCRHNNEKKAVDKDLGPEDQASETDEHSVEDTDAKLGMSMDTLCSTLLPEIYY